MYRISVVTSAYNAARFIGGMLKSLARQTRLPDEVVVVDDGSQDDTYLVVERFRAQARFDIKLIRQTNQGLPAGRNAGIAVSTGDLICFLDADDVIYPEFLARTSAALAEHPEWAVCFSDRDILAADGALIGKDLDHPGFAAIERTSCGNDCFVLDDKRLFEKMLPGNLIPMTVVVRADVVRGVGGFDTQLRIAEDLMFFLQIIKRGGGLGFVNLPLGTWQRHESNLTSPRNDARACMYMDRIYTTLREDRALMKLSAEDIQNIDHAQRMLGPKWLYALSSGGSLKTLPRGLRLLADHRITLREFAKSIARATAAIATFRRIAQ